MKKTIIYGRRNNYIITKKEIKTSPRTYFIKTGIKENWLEFIVYITAFVFGIFIAQYILF